jgi:hypothetical protein
MNEPLRDNLMTTMAMRIAYMDCAGCVCIPSGLHGEEELACFVGDTVDAYINNHDDLNFDEFIETEIAKRYQICT